MGLTNESIGCSGTATRAKLNALELTSTLIMVLRVQELMKNIELISETQGSQITWVPSNTHILCELCL